MDNFTDALNYHINKGHRVLIYPEAHIWPYYNDIRHFKSVSFKYPVDDNAPIFTATTTFKKRKGCRKPKPIIYIDGPFFPDETLPYRERVNDLAERAYEAMCYRAHNENNYAYIELTVFSFMIVSSVSIPMVLMMLFIPIFFGRMFSDGKTAAEKS